MSAPKGIRTPPTRAGAGATTLAAGLLAALLSGCRGDRSNDPPRQFFPDMDDQAKVKAQSRSEFFQDFTQSSEGHGAGDKYGRSMRDPVPGTVAFGRSPRAGADGTDTWFGKDFGERADMLRADDDFYLGYRPVLDKAGKPAMDENGQPRREYLEYIPFEVNAELIALGKRKFEIICIVCHGGLGDGLGMVGQRWNAPLPTWHDPKYFHGGEKGQDGFLYYTIRHGVPNPGGPYEYKMRPYATKLTEHESWAIVAYVRALQESARGTVTDVPQDQRERLMNVKDNPAPGAAPTKAGGAS